MALEIKSPKYSFIQFNESAQQELCEWDSVETCIPVVFEDDLAFQFVIEGDSIAEVAELCEIDNSNVRIGLVKSINDEIQLLFTEKFERYRINDYQVLYNWPHGVPNFENYAKIRDCFRIKLEISTGAGYDFYSNCFQRIAGDCHTSVLEYGADENVFGFNYCASSPVNELDNACEPTIIQFSNVDDLVIPYTQSLIDKYGLVPTVQVWIYDDSGNLVDMGIRKAFDAYPPTQILLDFGSEGGSSSGIVKIK